VFVTPYFLARCDSLLHYIGFHGKIDLENIEDRDVAEYLMRERKIKVWRDGWGHPFLLDMRALPYNQNTDLSVHPVVLELVAENPANEELLAQYRKNAY